MVELEKVLPWRERGWVTADTHVHFLSPMSALLEGAAEGVNVVNLLASQWGELMTNVGDFDGRTTWGSREAGGDGEYLVRVGTENRQHVLGHISLLGYSGRIIAPMTTGGPDESALGDPIEILLTEWARQCKAAGRPGRPAALSQPARRARGQHRQRRDRRRRDDLVGRSVRRHRPLFALGLVSLPELRLPGRGGGRHGQDVGQHGRGHGAHLCPHRARRSRSPTRPGWRPSAGRDLCDLWPAARVRRGRPADGQPHRDDGQRRHGGRDVAGGQRHGADVARRADRQWRDPRERGRVAGAGQRDLVGQGGQELPGWRCWCAGTTPTSRRSSPRTPRR